MGLEHLERLGDAGEHAEREHVDFQDAKRVEIVLVPFDKGAVGHGGIADGNKLLKGPARDDEAAHMLGKMARETVQRLGEMDRKGERFIFGVHADFAQALWRKALPVPPADIARERARYVSRKPERLADIANGAAAAIGNDGRGKPRPVAAIARVNILDDLLAPLMLEIDIDVGRLLALGGHEPLEEKIDACRVNGGDIEHIAHRAIRGRAAPLMENAAVLGKAGKVPDGEEIGRVIEGTDEGKLVIELVLYLVRNAVRIFLLRAKPGQPLKLVLRRRALALDLIRVVVAQLVERKGEALHNLHRARHGFGVSGKEPCNFSGRLQMALGIGREMKAGFLDGGFFTDTGQDVLQYLPFAHVIMNIVDGNEGRPGLARKGAQGGEPACRAVVIKRGGGEINAPRRMV